MELKTPKIPNKDLMEESEHGTTMPMIVMSPRAPQASSTIYQAAKELHKLQTKLRDEIATQAETQMRYGPNFDTRNLPHIANKSGPFAAQTSKFS